MSYAVIEKKTADASGLQLFLSCFLSLIPVILKLFYCVSCNYNCGTGQEVLTKPRGSSVLHCHYA